MSLQWSACHARRRRPRTSSSGSRCVTSPARWDGQGADATAWFSMTRWRHSEPHGIVVLSDRDGGARTVGSQSDKWPPLLLHSPQFQADFRVPKGVWTNFVLEFVVPS